jgi:hypothetical protein
MTTSNPDLKKYFEAGDVPTESQFAELIDRLSGVGPYFTQDYAEADRTNNASDCSFQLETSTFSGWSCPIGARPATFRAVKFKARAFGGETLTQLRVRIRETSNTGTVIANVLVPFDTDSDDYQTVIFPANITNATDPLVFEVLGDAKMGTFSQLIAGNSTKYRTGGNIADTNLTASASASFDYFPHVIFLTEEQVLATTPAGVNALRTDLLVDSFPRLDLPPKINAHYNVPAQLFIRGFVEALNINNYDIHFKQSSINTGSTPGKQFPRYYSFTPPTTSTKTLTVEVYNKDGGLLDSGTVPIVVTNPISSPATPKRVICIGDSLTASDTWVTEFNRRLTGAGGSPAGKSFSNISFHGTQGSGANLHEGHSGRDWQWFATDAASPLTDGGGTLDFAAYVSGLGIAAVEQIYIFLGWNDFGTTTPKKDAAAWAGDVVHLRTILDGIAADFPSCKVTLMGLQLPSLNGGLATNYGDATQPLGNVWRVIQGVFGHSLAMKAIAAEPAYSGFVDFLDVKTHFDSDHNMPSSATAVNLRNSTTELIGANGIHPAAEGLLQIADVAYLDFASKYCT